MKLDNGILIIDPNSDNECILHLSKEISLNLESIKEIKVDISSTPLSSALFSLLVSIKRSSDNISIPIIDNNNNIPILGDVEFIKTKG